MNICIKVFGLVLMASLAYGCDTSRAEKADNATAGAIPEHQLRALQQAKDVEKMLLKTHAEQLNSVPK